MSSADAPRPWTRSIAHWASSSGRPAVSNGCPWCGEVPMAIPRSASSRRPGTRRPRTKECVALQFAGGGAGGSFAYADPVTEHHAPFSRWALARLILSATAGELSDAARALVPTSQDSLAPPGAFVKRALDLQRDAETALQLAVIVERERGAAWDLIGSMVGGDQHSANQRFGLSELRWRDALRETWSPATRESEGQAAALDEWVAGGPARSEAGARPVTDGLPRAGITEEITMALAELRSLDDPT